MRYEVVEDRGSPDTWRVEAIDEAGEGEVFGATFFGPLAKERAEQYAALTSWRTEFPTEEGYYWFRADGLKPEIVEVALDGDNCFYAIVLSCHEVRGPMLLGKLRGEWSGPLAAK